MPPKKRKRKQPTQTQSQSQKVIVNIGSKSSRKKRGGGGGDVAHRQNLAPMFISAPQVDYTPLLAMLTQQTRSLQPEPLRNPETPISSMIQSLRGARPAGVAATRRAGPTAANFQPAGNMERQMSAGSTTSTLDILESASRAPRSMARYDSVGRSVSAADSAASTPASVASTQVQLPSGLAGVSYIETASAPKKKDSSRHKV
jgi:hypothetical protein